MARTMEIVSKGRNHTAGNFGRLECLPEYETRHPVTGDSFPGKVFLAENVGATGMEVSLNSMPPGTGVPFFHKHRVNEELFIVLRGDGEFDVDGTVIPVTEGSVVRIAPDGSRSWKNTGKEPIVVICIQAPAGTLKGFGGYDGVALP